MFRKLKEKIKTILTKYSYQAVCYAEELIGGGNGKAKKEIAIEFLLDKLPIYLKPITFIIRDILNEIADELIEKAVDMLHSVQEQQKARLENKHE